MYFPWAGLSRCRTCLRVVLLNLRYVDSFCFEEVTKRVSYVWNGKPLPDTFVAAAGPYNVLMQTAELVSQTSWTNSLSCSLSSL